MTAAWTIRLFRRSTDEVAHMHVPYTSEKHAREAFKELEAAIEEDGSGKIELWAPDEAHWRQLFSVTPPVREG